MGTSHLTLNYVEKEFWVDEKDEIYASTKGLAGLLGVTPNTLTWHGGVLSKLKRGEYTTGCLSCFNGWDYKDQKYGIPSDLMLCIIQHFSQGRESGWKKTATRAKKLITAIGENDINLWLQEQIKPQEDTNPTADLLATIASMQQQITDQKENLSRLEEKFDQRLDVEADYPGIGEIINNAINQPATPQTTLTEPFTARDYAMAMQGKDLSKGECISLGRYAASAFQTLKCEKPEKRKSNVIYYYADLPAWATVYGSWLNP